MIVELVIGVLMSVVKGIIGLLPETEPPAWVGTGGGMLTTIMGYANGLGAWFPFSVAGTVLTALLVSVGVGFLIKVVRIIASFFTAGGGSAA